MTGPTVLQPVVNDDRWEAVRCDQNKRTIDVNHKRREVRWFCERCRKAHTFKVGQTD